MTGLLHKYIIHIHIILSYDHLEVFQKMYVRLKYLRDIVTYIFNNYYSFLVFPRAKYESRNGKRSNFCVENPHCKYFLYRKCQSVSQYHLFSDRCRVWSIA